MEKTCIQYIKEAAKKLTDSKLQELGAAKAQEIFNGVMRTVGLETLEEVYLFVALFDLTCKGETSDMDDLSSYFECSSLDLMEYVPALKSLESKGILVRRGKIESNILKQDYAVNDKVMSAVIENKPVSICMVRVDEVKIDKYELCKCIAEKTKKPNVLTKELVLYAEKIENDNLKLPFVQNLQKDVSDILDRILFYNVCYDNYENNGTNCKKIPDLMRCIYSNISQHMSAQKNVMKEQQQLIRLGLVEIVEDKGYCLRLTDAGKDLFYGDDYQAFCQPFSCSDKYVFIEKVNGFFSEQANYNSNDSNCFPVVKRVMQQIEESNSHILEVEQIRHLIPDDLERLLFYRIGSDIIGETTTSLSKGIGTIYPRKMRRKALNEFRDGHNRLQTLGLVSLEITPSLSSEKTKLTMTDEGKQILFGEDAELYINSASDRQLLTCDKIVEKRLFFTDSLNEQLSLLRNSLDETFYRDLCSRLEGNHLPKGICVLLYGEPGTGKTESVMQIAKATGRDIMHVDISETKNYLLGESEKRIKKVFTDYRHLCECHKEKPILLFNEADAVFSKRKDSASQTVNAMQNIILEEMEKLDGILVATTNLADNLDGAFERRFLFKIRFDKPTVEAKVNIWKNKLPALSQNDAQMLAASYEFSGGQIDNIVRKVMMQEIVKGERPTLDGLKVLCNEEIISPKVGKRIGFH